VEIAESENRLDSWTWGFYAFTGLRVRIARHLDAYVHGGYRFHFASTPNEVSYKTGETDSGGKDKTETFEVEGRFLPYEDVAVRGLDVRAGLTVAFGSRNK
jgi:hypothetical protein